MKYQTHNEKEKIATEYMLESYSNPNPISKYLYRNFYNKLDLLLKKSDASDRILEVGCGLGESSLRIQKMLNGQYFEVSEYDETYVKILLQNNFPISIKQESVYALERKNDEFDTVLLLEVLEHLDNYELALSEIFRVAKKRVIISVPNEPVWSILNIVRGKYLASLGNTPGHINKWNIRRLEKIISRYGKINAIFTPLPWMIFDIEVC